MDKEEIILRRLSAQHLLSPADKRRAARDICGVQAQYMTNAAHALFIRGGEGELPKELIKGWTIRGTMHVFDEADLPVFLNRGRRIALRPCDTMESDEKVTAARKAKLAEVIVEGVGSGASTREELKALCRASGMTETEEESVFDPWGGTIRALCEAGRICGLAQEKKAYRLCPGFEPMEERAARLELLRRYFSGFGPASCRDAAYFFGISQSKIKELLAELPLKTADFNGDTLYYIDNCVSHDGTVPRCLFLGGSDQLMLGYQKMDSLFLPPEHMRKIFSLAGQVAPALLIDSSVAGKWKKRGGRVLITLFRGESAAVKDGISAAAQRLWGEKTVCVFEE
ncbi:MAG: winged helix DNA-binding domain-containing protein [Oscillospiraceae bacterium]